MIVTEDYGYRSDGVKLVRTYSDAGVMISHNGALYEEAIDPDGVSRVYVETDIGIDITAEEALEQLREVLA